MDPNYLEALSKAYPWATESTMQEMLRVVTVDAATKKKALDTIKNQPTDYSEIVDVLKNQNLSIKKATDISIRFIKSFDRDSVDIKKFFDTSENVAWGIVSAADELGDNLDMTKFSKGRFGRFANIALSAGEKLAVGIATGVSVAKFFSQYAFEQEKMMRGMIDFGLILGDRTQYTNIRMALSTLGLTENEFLKSAQGFGITMANLEGTIYGGSMSLINLANSMNLDEENLGFGTDELFDRLMNEAQLLRRLGEIESLDSFDKRKIVRGFETSVGIASMLSELTGQERTQYLQNRQEMLEDIDFAQAFARSREAINDHFGEGAANRMKERIAFVSDLMGMVGPEFQEESQDAINRFLMDFNVDKTILNNITPNMYRSLGLLGSEVQEKYIALMQAAVETAEDDIGTVAVKFQDFAKALQMAGPVYFLNDDEGRILARSAQDNATLISKSFMNAAQGDFYVAKNLEKLLDADDPIRAVDQFKQTMVMIRQELVPGYNSTGFVIDHFTTGMKFIADAILDKMPEIPNDPIQTAYTDEYFEQKQLKDRLFAQATMSDTSTPEGMSNYLMNVRAAITTGNRRDSGQFYSSLGIDYSSIEELFKESGGSEEFSPDNIPPAVAAKRIAEALNEFGITDRRAVANILGMISGESGMKLVEESSYANTSVSRIKKVLASRALFYTDAELERLKKDDRAFYDAMYGPLQRTRRQETKDSGGRRPDTGGPISNSFIQNGDMGGYDYRGKGYVQLTGEDNYRRVGEFLGIDLVGNPRLTLDPVQGPRIAAAFYALMSDKRKANFIDARKLYKYTWGADPSSGKMDDYYRRVEASNTWLAMMNDQRWNEIDQRIPEEATPTNNSTPTVNNPVEHGMVMPRPDGQNGLDWDTRYSQTHNRDGTPKNVEVQQEINTDTQPSIDENNTMDEQITRELDEVNSNVQRQQTESESVQ